MKNQIIVLSLVLTLIGCQEEDNVVSLNTREQVNFIIHPYLQMPSSDSMTVRFETVDKHTQVWARPKGSSDGFIVVDAELIDESISDTRTAVLEGLKPSTMYEYFIVALNPQDEEKIESKSPTYAFKTLPNQGDNTELNIVAIGDTQNGDTIGVLADVVNKGIIPYACEDNEETCAEKISAITIAGDIVSTGNVMAHWRYELFEQMKNITPYVPLITVPDNHDYYDGSNLSIYKHFFEKPTNEVEGYEETWYSMDLGRLRIIGLDSFPISHDHSNFQKDVMTTQRQWLSEKLNSTKNNENIKYVFSMFHHPCLSELWITGESLGSCELVAETEKYSKDTGNISGHFFGHTHAYSRGQSMDTNHLWVNASTSQGYREPIHDNHMLYDVHDYNTFAISRSEFGFNILTFNIGGSESVNMKRYSATVANKVGGYGSLQDGFEMTDEVTVNPGKTVLPAPQIISPNGEVNTKDITLEISHSDPDSIYEVQWQLSKDDKFENDVYDLWGNRTRKHNVMPKPKPGEDPGDEVDPTWREGDLVDSQEGVDLTKLALANFIEKFYIGGDEAYKWSNHKYTKEHQHMSENDSVEGNEVTAGTVRREKVTHISSYDRFSGQGNQAPQFDIKHGDRWYWKVRVRSADMNWSEWSEMSDFELDLLP